ncbi:hypothetical protein [Flavobacterium chilense]|nr:hypothetical protein [Flavobacterium chilense]
MEILAVNIFEHSGQVKNPRNGNGLVVIAFGRYVFDLPSSMSCTL